MAQLLRASTPGVCCVERYKFEFWPLYAVLLMSTGYLGLYIILSYSVLVCHVGHKARGERQN